MDRSKRVVQAFLNSAEGYFSKKRVIEDNSKSSECIPCSEEPGFNQRDITKIDLNNILAFAINLVDWDLHQIMPDTALNASLQTSIHSLENGKFQNKIDAKTYDTLFKILALKAKERGI